MAESTAESARLQRALGSVISNLEPADQKTLLALLKSFCSAKDTMDNVISIRGGAEVRFDPGELFDLWPDYPTAVTWEDLALAYLLKDGPTSIEFGPDAPAPGDALDDWGRQKSIARDHAAKEPIDDSAKKRAGRRRG